MSKGETVTRKGKGPKAILGKKKEGPSKTPLTETEIKGIREGTLADFFARSPLRGVKLERPPRSFVRKINL
jgi:hypothetical protein